MSSYVIATGITFALIFAAHLARIWAEGSAILREPFFLITTALSFGLAVWAAVLVFRRRS